MGLLSRDDLLKPEVLKKVKVVLSRDQFVYVRQMTGHERENFERSILKVTTSESGRVSQESSLEDFRAKLAVCTMCDEEGKLLMKPMDYDTLSRSMSADKLMKIAEVAATVNAISEKEKKEMVKN